LSSAWPPHGGSDIVSRLLYGVQPDDLANIGIAVGVLMAAGTLAAWIPARRAARIDPIQALRYE
jgi:putative ABC transport system permease protein